jgi:hypothetical protein
MENRKATILGHSAKEAKVAQRETSRELQRKLLKHPGN